VAAILRARRAPSSTIDDAVQAAAERALRRAGGFDSLDGLVNWMVTVAWRETQSQWRRQSRCLPGEIPDRAGGHDPAALVEDRLGLEGAVEALKELTSAERTAILSSLSEGASEHEALSAAEKMRRYRARRRLAAIIAGCGEEI
jgi:DNA-directed RNA polymerase specialized sigma24 family protein